MSALDKSLSLAILRLPQAKRDKMLLQLIAKDEKLVLKLSFELLEGTLDDIEVRRSVVAKNMDIYLDRKRFFLDSPGEVMMAMRKISGEITEHVRVTKDKMGSLRLNLLMINKTFEKYGALLETKRHKCETFTVYTVKRLSDTLANVRNLHEDYLLDYRDDLNLALRNVHNHVATRAVAKEVRLPESV